MKKIITIVSSSVPVKLYENPGEAQHLQKIVGIFFTLKTAFGKAEGIIFSP